MHAVAIVVIVALSVVLMLVRPLDVAEGWWVSAGALLLVLLGLLPARQAWSAVRAGSDVYLFLIGMMVLCELGRSHGLFDWLAAVAVRHAGGSPTRLFALLYLVGVAVTICLSNDATAVVLTPAVAVAVKRANVPARPHLFACAFIANAASFVLPISNPANLVLYQGHMPSLVRWLTLYSLPSLLSILATYFVLRAWFRDELTGEVSEGGASPPLPRAGRVVAGGVVLVVATLVVSSWRSWDLGLPTCLASLAVAAVVCIVARSSPLRLVGAVSWLTLLLVAGLFVLVRATESLGALTLTERLLRGCHALPAAAGVSLVGSTLALANNVFNNLPVGLLTGATLRATHEQGILAGAAVIGVDLGPNLAVTGSLATVLWLLALRREGIEVRASDFLKVGAVAMPLALVLALAGLLVVELLIHLN